MTPLDAGAALPDLTLDGPDGPIRLHDVAARGPLIIAFYQEDATPICTAQLCAFRDDFDLIGEAGARLLAISADDRTSPRPLPGRTVVPVPAAQRRHGGGSRAPSGVLDESAGRSLRAIFVSGPALTIGLAIPHYNPANPHQFQAVFEAIGLDCG